MITCTSCPATYPGSFAEANGEAYWQPGPKCPACSRGPRFAPTQAVPDDRIAIRERQEMASECLRLLDAHGMGKNGRPNCLVDMVAEALKELSDARSESERLRDVIAKLTASLSSGSVAMSVQNDFRPVDHAGDHDF